MNPPKGNSLCLVAQRRNMKNTFPDLCEITNSTLDVTSRRIFYRSFSSLSTIWKTEKREKKKRKKIAPRFDWEPCVSRIARAFTSKTAAAGGKIKWGNPVSFNGRRTFFFFQAHRSRLHASKLLPSDRLYPCWRIYIRCTQKIRFGFSTSESARISLLPTNFLKRSFARTLCKSGLFSAQSRN